VNGEGLCIPFCIAVCRLFGSKMNFRTPDCSLTAKIGLFWVGVKYSLLYYQQSGVIPPDLTVGISATKKTFDNQHDIQ
jgi:hypothetical protein